MNFGIILSVSRRKAHWDYVWDVVECIDQIVGNRLPKYIEFPLWEHGSLSTYLELSKFLSAFKK